MYWIWFCFLLEKEKNLAPIAVAGNINICQIFVPSSGYAGNLMAMLTYPARNRIPNTFAELLQLSDEFTFGITRHSSHWQLLRDSTDPELKVINNPLVWSNKTRKIWSWPSSFQGIFQQIENQNPNITHKKSGSVAVKWLLKSPTPGVYISEIDAFRLYLDISKTTLSGTLATVKLISKDIRICI